MPATALMKLRRDCSVLFHVKFLLQPSSRYAIGWGTSCGIGGYAWKARSAAAVIALIMDQGPLKHNHRGKTCATKTGM